MNHGEQKCLTCAYAELTPNGDDAICRFFPPQTFPIMTNAGPSTITVKTVVKITQDWCGQHEMQLVKPVVGLRIEK